MKETNRLLKGKTSIEDIDFELNGKNFSIELQSFQSDLDFQGEVSYTFINGDENLTDDEKDEVDEFINNNY
jgi:hypothetical protein